jgi:hypothetical protein
LLLLISACPPTRYPPLYLYPPRFICIPLSNPQLRQRTLDAQAAEAQRQRDIRYGRPAPPLPADAAALLAGAPTLRARLKAHKAAEARYWMAKPHHQMRPKDEDVDKARSAARAAAEAALEARVKEMAQASLRCCGGRAGTLAPPRPAAPPRPPPPFPNAWAQRAKCV